MIIDKHADIPFTTCKNAYIRPKDETDFSGMMHVDGERYLVAITRVMDAKRDIPRVWARVEILDSLSGEAKLELAKKAATQGRKDPAWEPVKVDLRNGRTAFMKTWTHGYPDDAAMDAFLADAKRFIEQHGGELNASSPLEQQIDIDDLLDRL